MEPEDEDQSEYEPYFSVMQEQLVERMYPIG